MTLAETLREQEDQPFLPFEPQDEIQKRFLKYHADNPHVYIKLVELAYQVKNAGRTDYGIDVLFARLRWHYDFETRSDEGFKLNNNYRSRYARLLMEQEPGLHGLFHIRHLSSERVQK